MYRSFVFPRELLLLRSCPGESLRLSSPGSPLAHNILSAKGVGSKSWDEGGVTADRSYWSEAVWIVGRGILQISPYEPFPDCPIFSTENDRVADHLLHLGAEEIEYRDPTPLIVWKIEVFDASGDVAGWVEPLLDKYKYLGVPL